MLVDSTLRALIAASVHRAITEADTDGTGVWLCEWYAMAGSEVVYVLTGWHFEPVAGISGSRGKPQESVTHASGLSLDARPSWADLVKNEPEPGAHAWLEDWMAKEVVDFSLRPFIWNRRKELDGHVFARDEQDTQKLQGKYERLSHIIPDITRRAVEIAAPATLAVANGETTHILERIANRWEELADRLAGEINRNRRSSG